MESLTLQSQKEGAQLRVFDLPDAAALAVEGVADERIVHLGKVDTNLMGSTGFES